MPCRTISGFPRVNLVRASERPGGPARIVNRKLVAQVDRAIVALDEYLSQDGAGLKQTEEGAEFEGQIGRLRLDLLQLRQRSVAKESTGPLSPLFLEIESINRQLRERAKPDSRIIRGDVTFKAPAFCGRRKPWTSCVNSCRSLRPRGKNAVRPVEIDAVIQTRRPLEVLSICVYLRSSEIVLKLSTGSSVNRPSTPISARCRARLPSAW